jgi:outer membrane protein insertion porin family
VIRAVRVEGVEGALAATLAAAVKTRAGQTFGDAPLKDDVRRLWALGMLDDVRLEARGSEVAFVVAPSPRVFDVELHAADKDGVRRFALLRGAPFEPGRVTRMANAVRLLYVREGRLDAKVTVGRKRRPSGIGLCVAVEPGPKVTVGSIAFPGRRAIPESVLVKAMAGYKKGGIYDEAGLQIDELRISAEYWDRGYANVHVTPHRVVRAGNKLRIEIAITEGDIYRLGAIHMPYVTGLALPIKTGDIFSRTKIADARELIAKHLHAEMVLPLTKIDTATRTITLTFEPHWRWPWDAFLRWPAFSR